MPAKNEARLGEIMSVLKVESETMYPVFGIDSLRDYVELLELNLCQEFAIFRGQSRDWELVPRIATRMHVRPILENEQAMFNAFRHEAVSFVRPEPSSEWEWLAVAQHHGLPTRLLDWSTNALGALWFAVRRPGSGQEHGVVWIFLPADADVIRSTGTGESPFSGTETKVYLPRHIVGRVRSQEAAFTVHEFVQAENRFIPLDRNRQQNHKLIKVIIPAGRFAPIRHDLYRCGIHAGSLFPDVGGIAERIRSMYLYQEDEDQETMLKWKY
ncbi:FRG domain-containing protein [Geobacter sp. DSM 9736]|uniref:FRG domain-containing protein n=1 Tax=Geobacter sp. DSM 9736 TaxID=1277350 RepID=UPI000B5FA399|nr:FRG domain-containing protein [Geobacter sp. DSM 9736]SNB46790.1 FRG domain-containing protein [Geobacter sp. DSM 9736]